jgi:hypothetical protein
VFKADMIFSIVAHHALKGTPITLKELATYFELFVTEATVSRHLDDIGKGRPRGAPHRRRRPPPHLSVADAAALAIAYRLT